MKSILLSLGMTLTAFRNFYFAIGLALMWGSTMAELNKGRQLFEAGDYKEALAELTAADTVALPEAQNLLGRIYYFGKKDVPINHSQAVAWFLKAAEQGYALAQNSLGIMHHEWPKKALSSPTKMELAQEPL